MGDLLIIYTSDEKNIEQGIADGLWGVPPRPGSPQNPKGDVDAVRPGTVILLVTGLKGTVRVGHKNDPDFDIRAWTGASTGHVRSVDGYLAVADSHMYVDHTPHWANEPSGEPSKYPFRFLLTAGKFIGPLRLEEPAFNEAVLKALRLAAIIPAPILVPQAQVGGSEIFDSIVSQSTPELAAEALESVPTSASVASGPPSRRKRRVQAFGRDQARNSAVEERAVAMATTALELDGWDVTSKEADKVGYDLLCVRNIDGSLVNRHAEVKGSSSEIDEVIVTPNELQYALDHPESAWLVVVQDIQISHDATGTPIADGGEVTYSGPWSQLPGAVRPLKSMYRFR